MKHTRQCPKCGGRDIVTIAPGPYNSFPAVFFAQAKLERWACCTCGCTEEWVEDAAMEQAAAFWREGRKDKD